MKKLIILSVILLTIIGCKKKEYSPEGPTDVRIRNISDMTFGDVVVSTSEKSGDTIGFGVISKGTVSDYFRFQKAYPKAEISASIELNGSPVKFTTGTVNYAFMQYIGQDRITFEVYISNMNNHELTISNVILDEALILK